MTVVINPIGQKYDSVQYDGTNGSEIADLFNDIDHVVSDNGTVVVFEMTYGGEYSVPQGAYVIRQETNGLWGHYVGSDYTDKWQPVLPPKSYQQELGVAAIPLLTASGETTVQVSLTGSFSNTNYSAKSILSGPASILSSLEILSTAIINQNRVDVSVRNNDSQSLSGGSVIVSALGEQ